MISGIAHINLTVTPGTLAQADDFYVNTLGFTSAPVPELQIGTICWFNIGNSGQQVHVTDHGSENPESTRHPCFKVNTPEELEAVKKAIYDHHTRGGPAAPLEADKPGEEGSGTKGKEYPTRFFARDYAGNRLEFSL